LPWTDDEGPVPHRSPEELRVAAHAHAEAIRERRRRVGALLSTLVLLLGGISVAVARTDTSGSSLQVRADWGDATPTSTPPTTAPVASSTTTGSPLPLLPPTSVSTTRSTPTTARPVASTTTRPSTAVTTTTICRNSFDPACGPLVWEPPAGVNRPLIVSVTASPSTPRAGERVTFRVVGDDPDAAVTDCRDFYYGDDSDAGGCSRAACPPQYGPWAPVAVPGHRELNFDHVYATPGSYRARFYLRSGECGGAAPYGNGASGEITVVVAP
jgi:hypothetical protein